MTDSAAVPSIGRRARDLASFLVGLALFGNGSYFAWHAARAAEVNIWSYALTATAWVLGCLFVFPARLTALGGWLEGLIKTWRGDGGGGENNSAPR